MTRALIRAALVIALVTAAVFLLIRLVPGDPVVMVLGEHATDEAVNQLREQLHLNDSLGQQFLIFLAVTSGIFRLAISTVRQEIPAAFANW